MKDPSKILNLDLANDLLAPDWCCNESEDGTHYELFYKKTVVSDGVVTRIPCFARRWPIKPKALIEIIQYVARRS